MVLTPRLSGAPEGAEPGGDAAAAEAAEAAAARLGAARDAAAVLLADDTLGRLLGDAAVARTLRRLRAERGPADGRPRLAAPGAKGAASGRRAAASQPAGASNRGRPSTGGPPTTPASPVSSPPTRRSLEEASGPAAAVCPAAGAAPLRASPTEHRQLDFTGGYEADAHCEWAIRCEGDQVVVVRFTSLDTGADYDFVTMCNGGNTSSPRVAHLSGSVVPGAPIGVRGGEMLAVFTSYRYAQAGRFDGFGAEYWCHVRQTPAGSVLRGGRANTGRGPICCSIFY